MRTRSLTSVVGRLSLTCEPQNASWHQRYIQRIHYRSQIQAVEHYDRDSDSRRESTMLHVCGNRDIKKSPIASSNTTQSETPGRRGDEGNNPLIPNGSPGMEMGRWGKLLCDVARSRELCWASMVMRAYESKEARIGLHSTLGISTSHQRFHGERRETINIQSNLSSCG